MSQPSPIRQAHPKREMQPAAQRMAGRLSFASKPVHAGIVVAAILVAIVSFALSFQALTSVASWAGVPPNLVWAVPVVIDASIIVYAGASFDLRARGEAARLPTVLVFVFTALSVVGNAAHANEATLGEGTLTIIGTLLAVSAPMSVFLITHILGSLIGAPTQTAPPPMRQTIENRSIRAPESPRQATVTNRRPALDVEEDVLRVLKAPIPTPMQSSPIQESTEVAAPPTITGALAISDERPGSWDDAMEAELLHPVSAVAGAPEVAITAFRRRRFGSP